MRACLARIYEFNCGCITMKWDAIRNMCIWSEGKLYRALLTLEFSLECYWFFCNEESVLGTLYSHLMHVDRSVNFQVTPLSIHVNKKVYVKDLEMVVYIHIVFYLGEIFFGGLQHKQGKPSNLEFVSELPVFANFLLIGFWNFIFEKFLSLLKKSRLKCWRKHKKTKIWKNTRG